MNKKSIIGEELEIFQNKFDKLVKVGMFKVNEMTLESKATYINALQEAIKTPDKGTYSVHLNHNLFSSFEVEVNKIKELHNRSLSTGVVMPCWSFFKQ
jgi:cyclopropane fatty-acyl-phospholipid synthase-like methyltransferase